MKSWRPGNNTTGARQKAEYTALVGWVPEAKKITQGQRTELLAWLNGPKTRQAEAQHARA